MTENLPEENSKETQTKQNPAKPAETAESSLPAKHSIISSVAPQAKPSDKD